MDEIQLSGSFGEGQEQASSFFQNGASTSALNVTPDALSPRIESAYSCESVLPVCSGLFSSNQHEWTYNADRRNPCLPPPPI